MRNPKWQRDELILTLNLYYNLDSKLFTNTNSKIIELSKQLNSLPIYSQEERNLNFRNANGVAMKLSNFMAIDIDNTNRGLSSYSKKDEEIFNEFYGRINELKQIANLILNSIQEKEVLIQLYSIENESDHVMEGSEGGVLYKLHKLRERDSGLINKKKQKVLKEMGKLECEVCSFNFYDIYGELGYKFIECHHIRPLSTYESKQKTTLEDLALVCSNCHRMLHRNIKDMSIERLKEIINNN
ncbi:HNH endonuclease [Chryseobacterium sp. G0162]|uniref:HNH endonuclease n=1 Tax=unclassified Chryseobacterium TaxID=2593645 RepID=UPI000F4F25F1|nr:MULTISPECIES: HNH endonuclease [unclassified Chryseobacterium]AZB10744.1 HNH endonuclease [Chryseobacterium sp. G0162]